MHVAALPQSHLNSTVPQLITGFLDTAQHGCNDRTDRPLGMG
jgi:hypothetical protein